VIYDTYFFIWHQCNTDNNLNMFTDTHFFTESRILLQPVSKQRLLWATLQTMNRNATCLVQTKLEIDSVAVSVLIACKAS
jgi:hypothetical protein